MLWASQVQSEYNWVGIGQGLRIYCFYGPGWVRSGLKITGHYGVKMPKNFIPQVLSIDSITQKYVVVKLFSLKKKKKKNLLEPISKTHHNIE